MRYTGGPRLPDGPRGYGPVDPDDMIGVCNFLVDNLSLVG